MTDKPTYEELEQRVKELKEEVIGRKRAEEALEYRVEFQRPITTLSTNFINLATDEIDNGINEALQKIGEFAGVDRSYVFLFCDNVAKMDNTHEWCAEGIEPQMQNNQGLLVKDFPWCEERIKRFETVHIPRVADLPPEAIEKEVFQSQQIQSLILVPMIYGKSLDGFIGLDSVRTGKVWSEDIIALLRIVREVFVNALERKRAEEALQKSEHQLRLLSSQLLTAQEDERKRIARELHDSVGNSLTVIKFALEQVYAQSVNSVAMPGVQSLEAAILLVRETIQEVRRMQTGLRPPLLDHLGIVATISWFCGGFEKLYSGIRVEEQTSIEEKDVPDALKIVIFRVLQEALNNVGKYAKADLVRVSIRKTDGEIELTMGDNGVGFDVEHAKSPGNPHGGFGLTTMKERTELSGGSFSIESNKGVGTIVRASWQC
ncbi:MAG: GAF domain-containing sensor histidine kinase [Pseudomonadota bacterium]